MMMRLFCGTIAVLIYGRLLGRMRKQRRFYEEKLAEQDCLRQQNRYFTACYRSLEKQKDELRRLRHDLANNYILELSYLEKGKLELLKTHYEGMLGLLKSSKKFIYTGNVGIDSLLDYKLEEANRKQIIVRWQVQTDGKVRFSDRDLNILLGNLLDNAIEAAEKVEKSKRNISMQLKTDKTAFLFQIRNSCLSISAGKGNEGPCRRLKTTKKNAGEHGLGMGQIERIVKKYQGQMEIVTGEDFFDVAVFLYMEPE